MWDAMLVPDLAVIDVHAQGGKPLNAASLNALALRLKLAGVRAELTADAVRVSLDYWERAECALEAVGPVKLSSPWDDCGETASWREEE